MDYRRFRLGSHGVVSDWHYGNLFLSLHLDTQEANGQSQASFDWQGIVLGYALRLHQLCIARRSTAVPDIHTSSALAKDGICRHDNHSICSGKPCQGHTLLITTPLYDFNTSIICLSSSDCCNRHNHRTTTDPAPARTMVFSGCPDCLVFDFHKAGYGRFTITVEGLSMTTDQFLSFKV